MSGRYVIADDSTGEIVSTLIDFIGEQALEIGRNGKAIFNANDGETHQTHYIKDGELTAYTPEQAAAKAAPPRYSSTWSNSTMSWSDPRTLSEAQATQRDLIDAGRVERTFSPIEYSGALFDADEVAMRNVAGWQTQIAAGVALPEGFVWRDAANVDHVADADFVNGLGAAITLRGTYLYAQAWALKAAIDAATTKEDVEAITWPT